LGALRDEQIKRCERFGERERKERGGKSGEMDGRGGEGVKGR